MRRYIVVLGVVVFCLISTNIHAFKLQWSHSGTYSDNTAIEPANLPVLFDAWQDTTQIANGTTAFTAPLADNTFGATHTYRMRARLKDGRTSPDVVVTLTTPADDRVPAACNASGMSIVK